MATEGYVPATSDAQTIMNTAMNRGLVIECTGALGVTHSYRVMIEFASGFWACNRVSEWNDDTWVVPPEKQETIANCIRRCDPDYRLIDESLSTFGDGGENDAE